MAMALHRCILAITTRPQPHSSSFRVVEREGEYEGSQRIGVKVLCLQVGLT